MVYFLFIDYVLKYVGQFTDRGGQILQIDATNIWFIYDGSEVYGILIIIDA